MEERAKGRKREQRAKCGADDHRCRAVMRGRRWVWGVMWMLVLGVRGAYAQEGPVDAAQRDYDIDWQRLLVRVQVYEPARQSRGPLAQALPMAKVFAQSKQRAWRKGLLHFQQTARSAYSDHYMPSHLHSAAAKQEWLREADRASERATRYVFSSETRYFSDGSVQLFLASRLYPVLGKWGLQYPERYLQSVKKYLDQQSSQKSTITQVVFRFGCDTQPMPWLQIYGGEDLIYAPYLIDQSVFEISMLGPWVYEKDLAQDPEYNTSSAQTKHLTLECGQDRLSFFLQDPQLWYDMPLIDRRRIVYEGKVIFVRGARS